MNGIDRAFKLRRKGFKGLFFIQMVIGIWNELPTDMVEVGTITSFQRLGHGRVRRV